MTAACPTAFTTAWADWASRLSRKQELQQHATSRARHLVFAACAGRGAVAPPSFEGTPTAASKPRPGRAPFNVYARAYQNNAALLKDAVRGVGGVTDYHGQLLEFAVRMLLDASSPSNYLAANPEAALTRKSKGRTCAVSSTDRGLSAR
jgi:hypothetical protein